MDTLSGGERVKLRLALLLLASPDILLLDEPSNDLDLDTHDEPLLDRTANLIIHLERLSRRSVPRCTVARIGYRAYFQERQAGMARQAQQTRQTVCFK